jgi:non-homologous end joining protein Ku
MAWIEYKNMSFEKDDNGVWIHKDWALPGDYGDIHDKPADEKMQKLIEEAYQESLVKKKKSSFNPLKIKDGVELDFTKPIKKEDIQKPKSNPKPPKVSGLMGSFNPFKDGVKI